MKLVKDLGHFMHGEPKMTAHKRMLKQTKPPEDSVLSDRITLTIAT